MDRGARRRPSASRRHVDHVVDDATRPDVAGATRPASEQPGRRCRLPRSGPRCPLSAGRARCPGGRGQHERRGAPRDGRGRPPRGRLRRVAAGQPGVVGRRRRRLPRRARRGHRRRRFRLVPGGPARGRRAPARRGRRAPGPRGRLRFSPVRALARAPGRPAGRAGPVRRDAAARRPVGAATGIAVPLVQAGAERLPFGDDSFDLACSAFGAVPFVAEPERVMREVARVLRPGGRWVFAVNHPMRWMFPDDPGPDGLTVSQSYFDRTPYLEVDAQGRRPTSSTTARSVTGCATSSPPVWSSTTSWSPSGRRATSGLGPVVAAARRAVPRHRDLRDLPHGLSGVRRGRAGRGAHTATTAPVSRS